MTSPCLRTCLQSILPLPCAGAILVLLCLAAPPAGAQGPEFLRGDANVDGETSLSDALMLRRFLFNGGQLPTCVDAADANDDGQLDITDPVSILQDLFLERQVLAAPYPERGEDTTADVLTCESYEVVPPVQTEDVVRVGDVNVQAGEDVAVPIFMTTTEIVEAVQLVVEYDPEIFTPLTDVVPGLADNPHWAEVIAGSVNEELYTDLYGNRDDVCFSAFYDLSVFPEDGILTLGFIPSFICEGYEFPVGSDYLAFNILGTVSETAPPGTELILNPTNGPDDLGFGRHGLHNEFTHRGEGRFVSIYPEAIPGRMKIVPDIAIFIRGDSNGDAAVDLSDAQTTLGYLFLGDSELHCMDAADANDDGQVDIADPISVLYSLFLGGTALPPPTEAPGPDQTPDSLGCIQGLSG